jgi:serine/threonine protein kinase
VTKINKSITSTLVKYFLTITFFSSSGYNGRWARDSGEKAFEEIGQGLQEFKNEVALIAKLQHRNLVKLLGCCIQGGETMLIYEYMPNKSLDYFVFG